MATTVVASSLECVTHIASNPPTNFNVPIEGLELPLVLYIVRVPGSRDVFLTPMKPRDRVVSAQDVQSALYFIHANSAKDFEEPQRSPREEPLDFDSAPPLPSRAAASNAVPQTRDDHYVTDVEARQPSHSRRNVFARKAVPSRTPRVENDENLLPDLPRLPPRPLPAPPDEDASSKSSLYRENIRLLRDADHTRTKNPYDQTYPAGEGTWIDPAIRPLEDTLTLIRRNTSTHEQWNVASIHDPPIHEVSSAALLNTGSMARSRKSRAPIYLDITNPSYAQFLDDERVVPRASNLRNSPNHRHASIAAFHRRLYMPSSRHGWPVQRSGHPPNESIGSNEDPQFSQNQLRNSIDMSAAALTSDRRSRGYVFDSPWNSLCEFHTGATGNNLKCRHVTHGGRSVEISELRFNLPTTTSARGASGAAAAGSEKRGSYMHKLHQRMRSADATTEPKPLGQRTPTLTLDEDERVDLSLGRERAGGGFAGRQAKLGKLIIEPEGMKMLDLLVAANIGLWWRAYER